MNRGPFYLLMIPLLALAALLQSTTLTRFEIQGVKPELVLILLVVGTLIYGSRAGVVWAFFAGIFLDVFSGGPMGSSSLALMTATLLAGLGHHTFSRFNLLVPLTAMALSTFIYALTYIGILRGVDLVGRIFVLDSFRWNVPISSMLQQVVVPAALYNTILVLFLLPILNRVPESHESVSTLG